MGGDVLTWGALIAASGSLLAWAGFWMRMGSDRQRIANVETTSAANAGRLELQATAFADYKEKAAREFASTNDLADAERRFADAVNSLKTSFDRMTERLDRVLEGFSHGAGRQHQ